MKHVELSKFEGFYLVKEGDSVTNLTTSNLRLALEFVGRFWNVTQKPSRESESQISMNYEVYTT